MNLLALLCFTAFVVHTWLSLFHYPLTLKWLLPWLIITMVLFFAAVWARNILFDEWGMYVRFHEKYGGE